MGTVLDVPYEGPPTRCDTIGRYDSVSVDLSVFSASLLSGFVRSVFRELCAGDTAGTEIVLIIRPPMYPVEL